MPTTDEPVLRAAVTQSGETAVVTLTGELDLATADGLRARLVQVLDGDPPPARVVLDASGLDFLDAAGISVLLSAQRSLAARGGQLCLREPSRIVRRVVRVLQLEQLLPLES
jgi:anti-sigma B factor antagonist